MSNCYDQKCKDKARELVRSGQSEREVARLFGVSKTTIGLWVDPKRKRRQVERTKAWQRKNWEHLREYQRKRGNPIRPRVTHKQVTYFVLGVGTGLIKVGTTKCLPDRLKNLQCGSPVKLRLIGLASVDEGEIRHLFHADRRHGEWYKDSRRLRKIIKDRTTNI